MEIDAKTSAFIIKRQNDEIRRLKDELDSLNSVIDDKNREIRRLKYRVNKLSRETVKL
jgi:cell division protein FtsL